MVSQTSSLQTLLNSWISLVKKMQGWRKKTRFSISATSNSKKDLLQTNKRCTNQSIKSMTLLDKSQTLMQFFIDTMELRIVFQSELQITKKTWPISSSMSSGLQMRPVFSRNASERQKRSSALSDRKASKAWRVYLRRYTPWRKNKSSLIQRLNSLECMSNLRKWWSRWKKTIKACLKRL